MPLVVDQLQLWTIGLKWAGFDPLRPWFRLPVEARDNFSTLLEAILSGHLDCLTLITEKYQGDDNQIARCHLHFWLDDVYAGVQLQRFNRKLLRHAVIDRDAFKDWCERRNIPLPEFWFPPGWKDYRWPEQDFLPIPEASDQVTEAVSSQNHHSPEPKLRSPQLAKIVCKQLAKVIWKDNPEMTIAAMCKHELISKYGGGQYFSDDVVRRWVKEVAPAEVSAKKGRPRKKNPAEGD